MTNINGYGSDGGGAMTTEFPYFAGSLVSAIVCQNNREGIGITSRSHDIIKRTN